jgi:predicted AAA+ superfamily ATPase
MITRVILKDILTKVYKGKAILILGPRQSGKTTLLKQISKHIEQKPLLLNCDDSNDRSVISTQSLSDLRSLIGLSKLILLDEAQRVQDIGITMKLIVDNFPEVQLIATGSSSFELSNSVNEPLTGRKYEYHLYPISYEEMADYSSAWDEQKALSNRLVYGMYPDIIINPGEEQRLLNSLTGSYLYKDIFTFQDLRKPDLLDKLLRALALQIGSEVSYTELAQLTSTDQVTIQKYINLLEQAYIVFRLPNYSSNQRREIKRSRKIFFYDNGIRNALINDYRPLELRADIGQLWENYIVSERVKLLSNHFYYRNSYFWRSLSQVEVDYIETYEDKINGYEIKWNPTSKLKSKQFINTYPHATMELISTNSYQGFLNPENKPD